MIYKSDDELQQACADWQKRLRLQDWIVTCGITRERDMRVKESNAEIIPSLPKRMATIHILDPLDYPEGLAEEQDQELSLVHELLHIHLFPLFADRQGELSEVAEEQAIEAISRALIEIYREKEK